MTVSENKPQQPLWGNFRGPSFLKKGIRIAYRKADRHDRVFLVIHILQSKFCCHIGRAGKWKAGAVSSYHLHQPFGRIPNPLFSSIFHCYPKSHTHNSIKAERNFSVADTFHREKWILKLFSTNKLTVFAFPHPGRTPWCEVPGGVDEG